MITIVPDVSRDYSEMNAQPMVLYRNLLLEGTLTNTGLPATNPRDNALTESTTDFWGVDATPDVLHVTLTGAESADCAFFAAHSIGSSGGSVTIQYHDGSTWVDLVTVTPADDQPFMILWPAISAARWGFSVTGLPNVGVAMIGPRLVIPGGVVPDYSPIWASKQVVKYPGGTMSGHWQGQRIERAGAQLLATFMPIDYDFVLEDMEEFRDHFNLGKGFVWASCPSMFVTDVAYCWASDSTMFQSTIQAGGTEMTLSLQMEAFIEP